MGTIEFQIDPVNILLEVALLVFPGILRVWTMIDRYTVDIWMIIGTNSNPHRTSCPPIMIPGAVIIAGVIILMNSTLDCTTPATEFLSCHLQQRDQPSPKDVAVGGWLLYQLSRHDQTSRAVGLLENSGWITNTLT